MLVVDLSQKKEPFEIDISKLTAGTYIIRLVTLDGYSIGKKLIKN